MPPNHPLFLESHLEDLLVEYFEDLFDSDERSMKYALRKYLGRETLPTGDPLVDFWEEQVARGEDPDLDIGEDARAKRRDAYVKAKVREHYERTGEMILYKEEKHPFGASVEAYEDMNLNTNAVTAFMEGLEEIK